MTGDRAAELLRLLVLGQEPTPTTTQEAEYILATKEQIQSARRRGYTIDIPGELPQLDTEQQP